MGKQRVLTDELLLSENHNLTNNFIEREQQYGATNYDPLPVVLSRGLGAELWDVSGKRYIDMMSAYSAVSHGHAHPKLVNVLTEQANTLAVVSRAFHTDKLSDFLQRMCEVTDFEKALPMNTGAEAVGPGKMSLTIFVPSLVASLTQSSWPRSPSSASRGLPARRRRRT